MRSRKWLISLILAGLALGGCTSPTISPYIHTTALQDQQSANRIRLLGGQGADSLTSRCLFRHPQGGVALFGQSIKSFGESTDFLMVRLTADGDVMWAATYGGTHRENIERVAAFPDGSYLITGASSSLFFTPLREEGGHRSGSIGPAPLAIKVDGDGKVQWATMHVQGTEVATAADGGFWVSGWRSQREEGKPPRISAVLQRFDSAGQILSERSVAPASSTIHRALGGPVVVQESGGVVQVLNIPQDDTRNWADNQVALVFWDNAGALRSATLLKGPQGMLATGLERLPAGDLLITGYEFFGSPAARDTVLIQTSPTGDVKRSVVLDSAATMHTPEARAAQGKGFVLASRIGKVGTEASGVLITLDDQLANPRVISVERDHLVEGNCILGLNDGTYAFGGTAVRAKDAALGTLDILYARVTLDRAAKSEFTVSARPMQISTEPAKLDVEQMPLKYPTVTPEIPVANLVQTRNTVPPAK